METAAAATCPRAANAAASDDAGSADARSIQPFTPAAGFNRRFSDGPNREPVANANPVRLPRQQEPHGASRWWRSKSTVQPGSQLPASGRDGCRRPSGYAWSSPAATAPASGPTATTQPESILTPVSAAAIAARNAARISGQSNGVGPIRTTSVRGNVRPELHPSLAADSAIRWASESDSDAKSKSGLLGTAADAAESADGYADQFGHSIRASAGNSEAAVFQSSSANGLRTTGGSFWTCADVAVYFSSVRWVQSTTAARRQSAVEGSVAASAGSCSRTWCGYGSTATAATTTTRCPAVTSANATAISLWG